MPLMVYKLQIRSSMEKIIGILTSEPECCNRLQCSLLCISADAVGLCIKTYCAHTLKERYKAVTGVVPL